MSESELAKERVANFLDNAKYEMLDRMERALRQIAKLRWWELWKCKRIAEQTLGIGRYWNQDFK